MSSKWSRKFDYLRERVENAWWMIKEGDFRQIAKSIGLEIHYRMEDVKEWIRLARLLDDSKVPGSSYHNRRKVIPPSYRPTISAVAPAIKPMAEEAEIARELSSILSSIRVRDNHSV